MTDVGQSARVDTAWFDALYSSTQAELFRFAARRVGRDAAADVVAETFTTAWRRRDEIDRTTARLWLFGVAHRVIANLDRARRRAGRLEARLTVEAARAAVADSTELVDTLTLVRSAIAQLPFAEAEALRLIEWEAFTVAEAARIAGCSPATFRVRLHRARGHAGRRFAEMDIRSSGEQV